MCSRLKTLTLAFLLTFFLSFQAQSASIVIPEMSTAGIRGMPVQVEQQFGEFFMRKARASGAVSYDPVLNEFINTVGQKLIFHANNVYFPFEFFLSSNPELNASAFLGGKVQVNAGLFHYTDSEDEFASVLAHEISHITQRHIARFLEEQSNKTAVSLAGIIGAVALSIVNPAIGMAAITTTTGLISQSAINFTRDNEAEADRIGISVLNAAGYNSMAMANLFRKLMKQQGNINKSYAMLIDHPLSEVRVAEASNRASGFPRRKDSKNPDFMLAKARVDIRYMHYNLDDLKKRLTETEKVNRYYRNYALALICFEQKNYGQASEMLNNLSSLSGNDFILDLKTDIDIAQKRYQSAIDRLRPVYSAKPNNKAVVLNLANAYIEARQWNNAKTILKKYLLKNPNDIFATDMLSSCYRALKEKCDFFRTEATKNTLMANYNQANALLTEGLHHCKGTDAQIVRAQFSNVAKMQEFDEKLEKGARF